MGAHGREGSRGGSKGAGSGEKSGGQAVVGQVVGRRYGGSGVWWGHAACHRLEWGWC